MFFTLLLDNFGRFFVPDRVQRVPETLMPHDRERFRFCVWGANSDFLVRVSIGMIVCVVWIYAAFLGRVTPGIDQKSRPAVRERGCATRQTTAATPIPCNFIATPPFIWISKRPTNFARNLG